MIKLLRDLALAAVAMAGHTHVLAGEVPPLPGGESLCDHALHWDGGTNTPAARIAPTVSEGDEGRSYHFDLGGKGGLQTLDAMCGWGSYAECAFTARAAEGSAYQFSDLSTFEVWEAKDGLLYLLYRIVAPKDEAAGRKRRMVRLGRPPEEICNQIGDYADLM